MPKSNKVCFIPPLSGLVFAAFVYAWIFSGIGLDSSFFGWFLEVSIDWVLAFVVDHKIGPGGCAGMIWFGIAPGVAWFIYGAVIGSIWSAILLLKRRRADKQRANNVAEQVAAPDS